MATMQPFTVECPACGSEIEVSVSTWAVVKEPSGVKVMLTPDVSPHDCHPKQRVLAKVH